MALAPVQAALAALTRGWRRALELLPFVKRRGEGRAVDEPFHSIEDATSSADMLLEANAAMTQGSGLRESKIDLRASLAAMAKNTLLVVCLLAGLAFLLVVVVTSIIVSSPPAKPKAPETLTREGTALVGSWIYPPGLSLEPRVLMEREKLPPYGYEDSIRLGIDPAKVDNGALRAANDSAIDELYRTVR